METSKIIRAQVLDKASVKLYQLRRTLVSNQCEIIKIDTDCIIAKYPKDCDMVTPAAPLNQDIEDTYYPQRYKEDKLPSDILDDINRVTFDVLSDNYTFDSQAFDELEGKWNSITFQDYMQKPELGVCIEGVAGTGKTLTIKKLIKALPGNFVVRAPTNMAARNIEGCQTNYSFFGMDTLNQVPFIDGVKTKIAKPKYIIIDEISMVPVNVYKIRRYI